MTALWFMHAATNSNCLRQSRFQCRCTNFLEQSACWHY